MNVSYADIGQDPAVPKGCSQGCYTRCTTVQREWRHNGHGHRGAAGK